MDNDSSIIFFFFFFSYEESGFVHFGTGILDLERQKRLGSVHNETSLDLELYFLSARFNWHLRGHHCCAYFDDTLILYRFYEVDHLFGNLVIFGTNALDGEIVVSQNQKRQISFDSGVGESTSDENFLTNH